ncbi:hypothetical protein C0J52_05023 [Blattella germanica]|nr:hypothetical protein C0J52_05023 [Blattella germanica]
MKVILVLLLLTSLCALALADTTDYFTLPAECERKKPSFCEKMCKEKSKHIIDSSCFDGECVCFPKVLSVGNHY